MAQNKGKRRREEKRWEREKRDRERQDVIQHSAATLTCAAETAGDFCWQCEQDQEELELDLPFLRLALEIWHQHPQSARALVSVLEELLSARLRHQEALKRIGLQLQNLAADPSSHIHPESPESYRELVRNRLCPQTPPR